MAESTSRKQFRNQAEDTGFVAVAATECVEGNHYFYPKVGPVVCKGLDTLEIQGIGNVQTYVFEEINMRIPKVLRVPKSKLKCVGIRELASEAALDNILAKIENADGSGFNYKGRGTVNSQLRYEKMIASNDLNVLAELVCKTLGCTTSDAKYKGRPTMGMEYGEKAICIIAAEYALVKGLDYTVARDLFTEKSGKHNRGKGKAAEALPSLPEASSHPS